MNHFLSTEFLHRIPSHRERGCVALRLMVNFEVLIRKSCSSIDVKKLVAIEHGSA